MTISRNLVSLFLVVAVTFCTGCQGTPKDPNLALRDAIRRSDAEGVTKALAGGASLESKDSAGWSPLHKAAAKGDVSVIKALIAGGAKLEERNEAGLTALHEALTHSKEDAARCLIEAGADVNAKSNSGSSVLSYARAFGSQELQAYIQQRGGL